jgi:ubiquinone/menaquinone biosynthesis C-methylase UbiE
MAVEWDERAAKDALHYIHTGRSSWDDADEFFDTGEKLVQQIIDPVIQCYIKCPQNSIAIDIGCGVGRVTRTLSHRFKLVYGFDVSSKMIELGKSMNSAYGNILFHQSDGQHLKVIEDSSVDYVFSFTTFQHMPSRKVSSPT